MEPPLHPRHRFLKLVKEIRKSSVRHASLRYQGLHDDQVEELIAALLHTTSLLSLDLTSSTITNLGITRVCSHLPSCLQVLKLSHTAIITMDAAESIAFIVRQSPSLLELHLDDCRMGNKGILAMAMAFWRNRNKSVCEDRSLPVTQEMVSIPGQEHQRLCHLQVWNLSKNQIGLYTSSSASTSSLTSVSSSSPATETATQMLGSVLRDLAPNLQHLDLSQNQLIDCDLANLQLHFTAPRLVRLDLSNNRLGKSSGTTLWSIFVNCHCLEDIHLCNNELGDSGIVAMFRGLADSVIVNRRQKSYPLRSLQISSNRLSDLAMEILTQELSLAAFPHLQTLCFSCNNIGDAGATLLANYIAKNPPKLYTLDLHRNEIRNQGGQALTLALNTQNVHLKHLNISSNLISSPSILCSIRWATKLNQSGRYILQNHDEVPLGLWPKILETMNVKADIRYYFLQRIPDVIVAGLKRHDIMDEFQ